MDVCEKMKKKEDALDKLILDENEDPNYDLLAKIILNYLRFTKSGEIIYEKEFNKLNSWRKVMIYLLGRKIIVLKKLVENFSERATPKEISKNTGVLQGSIQKYLTRELKGITNSEKGSHMIPNYNLHKCEGLLNKK